MQDGAISVSPTTHLFQSNLLFSSVLSFAGLDESAAAMPANPPPAGLRRGPGGGFGFALVFEFAVVAGVGLAEGGAAEEGIVEAAGDSGASMPDPGRDSRGEVEVVSNPASSVDAARPFADEVPFLMVAKFTLTGIEDVDEAVVAGATSAIAFPLSVETDFPFRAWRASHAFASTESSGTCFSCL